MDMHTDKNVNRCGLLSLTLNLSLMSTECKRSFCSRIFRRALCLGLTHIFWLLATACHLLTDSLCSCVFDFQVPTEEWNEARTNERFDRISAAAAAAATAYDAYAAAAAAGGAALAKFGD